MENTFVGMEIMNSEAYLNEQLPNYVFMKNHSFLLRISCNCFNDMCLQITPRAVLQYYIDTQVYIYERIYIADDIRRVQCSHEINLFYHCNTNLLRKFFCFYNFYNI